MKKTRPKAPHRKPTRSPPKKTPAARPKKPLLKQLPKPYTLLFLLVLCAAIGLKIYKADHTGIGYDESMTFLRFCGSLHTATHDFSSTNNHILNSIFIVFARELFSFYEHFIRIPSLTAGIFFSLALALVVFRLFSDSLLKLSALVLVLFVPFVFDYSFLARGYAFALAGIFINLALVIWLLDHPIRYRYRFVPVLIISLMNFITFGAMLSTFLIIAAFNLTFIFFFSHKIFLDPPNRIRPVLFSLISITLLTTGSLYALYYPILSDILNSRLVQKFSKEQWDDWNSFAKMIHSVLFARVFRPIGPLRHAPFIILMTLFAAAVLFHLVTAVKHLASKKLKKLMLNPTPQSLIIIFTILTLAMMFVYGVLMDKSLGRDRNNVFIIPLVILSALVCIDRFVGSLPRSPALALRILMSVLLLTAAAHNLPSPVRFGGHTFSGPLLRQLKEIDPDKTWKIGFSKIRRLNYMGLRYYDQAQFDYKFQMARGGHSLQEPGPFDIWVCQLSERPSNLPCLDYNYFKKFSIAVVVNTPLPNDKVTFNNLPLPDGNTVRNAQLIK